MVSEVVAPKKLISYEKVPIQIYATAHEASRTVANEVAASIKLKQQRGEYAALGLATGSITQAGIEQIDEISIGPSALLLLSFRCVALFNVLIAYHQGSISL